MTKPQHFMPIAILNGVVGYNAFKESVEGYHTFHPSKPIKKNLMIIALRMPNGSKSKKTLNNKYNADSICKRPN